ncbi:MAG TPA: DNA (cytosine-5-)-methyltransferase [Solirubrobacterales bacterium]|nr:DNA (cytosine-5-)-methyltransferase [Solirubrobacterales bacterium]
MKRVFNHLSPRVSQLEERMIEAIPEGGNWQSVPAGLSARVDQIRRRSEERGLVHTTYYGRLRRDMPSYTINTYFSRIGNGCFIHPTQPRLISLREGARLQSFPDHVKFHGPRRAQYEQIGNAVPPLLAQSVASTLRHGLIADLFSGAGGLSLGFEMAGSSVVYATDASQHACQTYNDAHQEELAEATDLSDPATQRSVVRRIRERAGGRPDILLAGPPCQGFSTAGNRRRDDVRSQLFWVPFRIAEEVKPAILVVENVQGILSIAGRTIPSRIAAEMSRLGLTTHMCVLRAERYGVPQRRTRVFFVGVERGHWNPPEPRHSLNDADAGLPEPLSVDEAISDLPPIPANGGRDEMPLRRRARTAYQGWARGEIDLGSLLGTSPREASADRVRLAA